jgi:hypothetical protein
MADADGADAIDHSVSVSIVFTLSCETTTSELASSLITRCIVAIRPATPHPSLVSCGIAVAAYASEDWFL